MKEAQRTISLILTFFLLAAIGFARDRQKDEKDAPDTLIKAVRFLEEKPLDPKAKEVRAWSIKWVIATDKVSVRVCSLLISGIDKKYKYSAEIFGQYTIAMAAFKLANPDKAKDEDAAQLAGIESALTSYDAMVKEQPKARNAFLDDLSSKRSTGLLTTYVAENNCKDKK
jgi:hypothetical protein